MREMLAGVCREEDGEVDCEEDCEEMDECLPWREGECEGDEEIVGTEVMI